MTNNKEMKIVFLADDFPPKSLGGAGIVACDLADGLKKRGYEIFVITTVQKKEEEGNINMFGFNIFKIYSNYHPRWQPYLSLYNPKTILKVEKIIKRIKPDIVHAHNIHYHLSYDSLRVAKKYAKAVFLTAHDVMLIHTGKLMPKNGNCMFKLSALDQIKDAKKRYNPFRNIIIKHYLKYVDRIFAVSNTLKNVLEVNGIKNIETIYNGIDIGDWQINTKEVENFRKKFGIQNKKVILFGGRLSGAKGGEVILRAISLAIKEVKNIVLLVAGDKDWYAEKMIKLTREIGIYENIRFTGWLQRESMKCAFFVSDICVTPSIYLDPFNLFNIEAGAAKKPVIGTCFGGTMEIIIENKTGYIVNPNKIELMAEKIIDLLKNSEKAKQFGEAGHKRVAEHFLLNLQIDKILKWYKKYV
ncbi:glycosyltransferase family 4 protein [Patescibacteria group bacterium]|nr:glycosyltransferase family 4 protein [Patescibacteria group bacterium]